MSDDAIELIRSVNPFPVELPAPAIEPLLARPASPSARVDPSQHEPRLLALLHAVAQRPREQPERGLVTLKSLGRHGNYATASRQCGSGLPVFARVRAATGVDRLLSERIGYGSKADVCPG